ncbi:MAG: cytochrome c oxidase assembly protein, partial [Rhodanobacter sp.]|nr:cytochrome c oxidase assembly protein [Rhodanobacter sp.]
MITTLLKWIVPWEFSWVFLATFIVVCVLYLRGSRRLRVPRSRQLAFWTGMAIIYLSLHTYLDYYAEHEFFMHRLQQLLLHHLAPLLIVTAFPASVLRAGFPLAWRCRILRPLQRSWPWRAGMGVLMNPGVATILFVVFLLGFFLDWVEITLIILPLVAPVVQNLGFDLVWFTILFAVCLQTSFLTPPVGFALFYIKGVCPPEIKVT